MTSEISIVHICGTGKFSGHFQDPQKPLKKSFLFLFFPQNLIQGFCVSKYLLTHSRSS